MPLSNKDNFPKLFSEISLLKSQKDELKHNDDLISDGKLDLTKLYKG